MDILLATDNPHKRVEIGRMLPGHRLLAADELGLRQRSEEGGDSFFSNALDKAHTLWQESDGALPVLAEDSGICVYALDDAPGIYSARFGNDQPNPPASDAERTRLLLQSVGQASDRRAYYVCCAVLLVGRHRYLCVQETWEGEIATSISSGSGGFGYDPIFWLPQLGMTAADLSVAEKDRLSHRGQAFARLAHWLAML